MSIRARLVRLMLGQGLILATGIAVGWHMKRPSTHWGTILLRAAGVFLVFGAAPALRVWRRAPKSLTDDASD